MFALLSALLLLSGCSTLPSGRGWGEDATIRPGWERVKESAANAARDPWTWVPLAGSAVFQVDDWDRRVSDWARDNTPVFGSQNNAENWSDDLRSASTYAYYASVLATPSGSEPGEWFLNKAKGTLVQAGAVAATGLLTTELKAATDRERPNGEGRESFPSGHTSSSAVHTSLAARNLESLNLGPHTRVALNVGLHALTIGTSWARIEAGWHFPSDTLFSMALGNFLAKFTNDAFLGLSQHNAAVAITTADGGAVLQWQVRF